MDEFFVCHALVLVAAGAVAAIGLTWFMRTLLFGIGPIDPLTYATVSAVLLAAAVLASYLPARRASSVNPVEALRSE